MGARDEVDELIEAWAAQRPDLSLEPMGIWSRITRLGQHLDRVRRECFHTHGLEGWEFDVLAALRRTGKPYRLTAGELTRQTHVTSGTMTNRVDRLVQRGFVQRQRDQRDKRSVVVELNPAGAEVVDAVLVDLVRAEQHLLRSVDDEVLVRLSDDLRTLLQTQQDHG